MASFHAGPVKWTAMCLLALGLGEGLARILTESPRPSLVAHVPNTENWLENDGRLVRTTYQGEFELHRFAQTPPGTRSRVAWLGGSSIRGGTLPDLEVPSLVERANRTENLNLAAPGLDSRHFLQMLPEVLSLHPHALVVYTGHNDRGNAVFEKMKSGAGGGVMLRLVMFFTQSRLFQLARQGLLELQGWLPISNTAPQRWSLSAQDSAAIRSQFESNLRQLVRQARAAGVQVVLVTPVSNPLAHPFAYQCPDALRELGLPTHHKSHGAFDLRTMDPESLHVQQTSQPDCRELKLFNARLGISSGKIESSLEQLEVLRDESPMPVSAGRKTLESIRVVARTEGAHLADAASAFKVAGGGIEPPGWFWDPNHLVEEGHQALAAVIAPVLEQALGLPSSGLQMPELPDLTLDGRAGGLGPQPPPDPL